MPSIPQAWPEQAEEHRTDMLRLIGDARRLIEQSKNAIIESHRGLAVIALAEATTAANDAATMLAKASQVELPTGRWPKNAAAARRQAEEHIDYALDSLRAARRPIKALSREHAPIALADAEACLAEVEKILTRCAAPIRSDH